MRVIYRGVDLMPLETLYFDWQPVYDDSGTDYLYTKVSAGFRSIINGISSVVPVRNGPPMNYAFESLGVLAGGPPVFRPSAPAVTPPGAAPGLTVPAGFGIRQRTQSTLLQIVRDPLGGSTEITHQAIRHRLASPRGKLFIFWGPGMESGTPAPGTSNPPLPNVARLFLESPGGSSPCDCKNGPFPRILSVPKAYGDATTLIVDWAVETYVDEAPDNDVKQTGALLSNRFSQIHEVAENGYTSITTNGVAIFRTDKVYDTPASPDASRPFLFMPIPASFTRKVNFVRGREDVTGVEYSYTDTQVHTNFVAGPYTKAANISIVHTQSVATQPDLIASAVAGYERMLGIRVNRRFANEKREAPVDPKSSRAVFMDKMKAAGSILKK